MFDNIGKKVQGLAKFLFWLGVIASFFIAVTTFINASNTYSAAQEAASITSGFIWLIAGPIGSWLGTCLLYLIGQVADDLHAVRFSADVSANPELRLAMDCMNNKEYESAMKIFQQLNGHIDCEAMILRCWYYIGMQHFENKNYDAAYDAFINAADYPGADEMCAKIVDMENEEPAGGK